MSCRASGQVKDSRVGGTWVCWVGGGCGGGWGRGGSKAAADVPSQSQGRAAAMAQLKAAGDPARDDLVCGDLYSDMAAVTSSAGESKHHRCDCGFDLFSSFRAVAVMAWTCWHGSHLWHTTLVTPPYSFCFLLCCLRVVNMLTMQCIFYKTIRK